MIKSKILNIINTLIILSDNQFSEEAYLASRNIKNIMLCDSGKINPLSLVSFNRCVCTSSAIKKIEKSLL